MGKYNVAIHLVDLQWRFNEKRVRDQMGTVTGNVLRDLPFDLPPS